MKYYIVGAIWSVIGSICLTKAGLAPIVGMGIICYIIAFTLFTQGSKELKEIARQKKLLSTKLPERHNLI